MEKVNTTTETDVELTQAEYEKFFEDSVYEQLTEAELKEIFEENFTV